MSGPHFTLPEFSDQWKAKCNTCAHLRRDDSAMTCDEPGPPHPKRPRYCIDRRDDDGLCGPQARLWKPRR